MTMRSTTAPSPRTIAEEQHAKSCQTTIITSGQGFHLRHASLLAYAKQPGYAGRFDLLTVLCDPQKLATPLGHDLLTQLVADAMLALDAHQGEQILVAVPGDPTAVVEAFRRQFLQDISSYRKPINPNTPIIGLSLDEAPEPSESVVIACMEPRQWDQANTAPFLDQLVKVYGLDAHPDVLAMPGGARDVEGKMKRSALTIAQLQARHVERNWQRIILTCHEDCAVFGGNAAFHGPQDQRNKLTDRLKISRKVLQERFPRRALETAIVSIEGGKIAGIVHL